MTDLSVGDPNYPYPQMPDGSNNLHYVEPGRRISFEESMNIVQCRYADALEELRVAHHCPDPDNCSFGGIGCMDIVKDLENLKNMIDKGEV